MVELDDGALMLNMRDDRNRLDFGRLDVVVNNAGGHSTKATGRLESAPLEAWRDYIDTNLTGTFLMIRECARLMMPQPVPYAAAKASVKVELFEHIEGVGGMAPLRIHVLDVELDVIVRAETFGRGRLQRVGPVVAGVVGVKNKHRSARKEKPSGTHGRLYIGSERKPRGFRRCCAVPRGPIRNEHAQSDQRGGDPRRSRRANLRCGESEITGLRADRRGRHTGRPRARTDYRKSP